MGGRGRGRGIYEEDGMKEGEEGRKGGDKMKREGRKK